MGKRWGEIIRQMKQQLFVGREAESDLFQAYVTDTHAQGKIIHIWGPGGTGKSTLLDQFAAIARQANAHYIMVDSRDFPHTPEGFCSRLLSQLPPESPDDEGDLFARCISNLNRLSEHSRVVLAIDTYEEMSDLDSWLRETFLMELPSQILVVLAGRHPLSGPWMKPPWGQIVKEIPLRSLTCQRPGTMLRRSPIPMSCIFSGCSH